MKPMPACTTQRTAVVSLYGWVKYDLLGRYLFMGSAEMKLRTAGCANTHRGGSGEPAEITSIAGALRRQMGRKLHSVTRDCRFCRRTMSVASPFHLSALHAHRSQPASYYQYHSYVNSPTISHLESIFNIKGV